MLLSMKAYRQNVGFDWPQTDLHSLRSSFSLGQLKDECPGQAYVKPQMHISLQLKIIMKCALLAKPTDQFQNQNI